MPEIEEAYERLGRRIRRLRIRIGLSQEELAHMAGLDRTYVSMVELAKRRARLGVLERIAKELDVELWELFQFEAGELPKGKGERRSSDEADF